MKFSLKKRIKQNRGITLVALVVTIIVLLILAGVSLGLVFNSDGLFSKANESASRYNQSKEDEERYLQGAEENLDRYNGVYGGSTTGIPTDTPEPTPEPTPTLPAKGEEPPEEGWTIEEAKGLVTRDGLQAHIGEKVEYNPTGAGTWRIFYYDNEVNSEDASKGYFGDPIGTLYLKKDFVSSGTGILDGHQKHTPSDGGALMKKMNPKWAKASNGDSINLNNEHCIAWLCDPEVWEEDYKVSGVADYAIGSPSVEMYMKAFGVYKEEDGDPDRNSTVLVNKITNTNGYSIGANNVYAYNGYRTNNQTIEAGPNNIFMTKEDQYWWLASPVCSGGDHIFCPRGGGYAYVSYGDYYGKPGICPIVALSK